MQEHGLIPGYATNGLDAKWQALRFQKVVYLRRTPHPVIVPIKDNKGYIRVLFYSYYATITGWGVLLRYTSTQGLIVSRRWYLVGFKGMLGDIGILGSLGEARGMLLLMK